MTDSLETETETHPTQRELEEKMDGELVTLMVGFMKYGTWEESFLYSSGIGME